jgi:putative sterol carrier protein
MLPIDVPPGTTLESLFFDVLPKAHAQMVPKDAAAGRFVAVQELRGFATYTLDIRGSELKVTEGAADKPDFWVTVAEEHAQLFLDDWMGPRRLAPKSLPQELVAISDPRILKRLAMVSAKAELALVDLDGERVGMVAASGAAAKKPIDRDDPDVVLEATADTFVRLVEGSLPPDEAIADGKVTVRGKKLLAMQYALAFAPFYPKR